MIRIIAKPALIAAASLLSVFSATTVSAEYRVTAFAATAGYSSLIVKDVDSAMQTFANRKISALDYAEANNLCVAEILAEDFSAAVAHCELALDKLDGSFELTLSKEKSARATIASNIAVAKQLGGELVAAQ